MDDPLLLVVFYADPAKKLELLKERRNFFLRNSNILC